MMKILTLTKEAVFDVNRRLLEGGVIAGQFIPWPAYAPVQHNACTDACDMWEGPCACGAWHKFYTRGL